jgi:hypothetical protein
LSVQWGHGRHPSAARWIGPEKDGIMADSQQSIDWNAMGNAALKCVGSACSLAHWGERSQEDDYNVDDAVLHLAAIDDATDILGRAIALFHPQRFNKIALASVGEGARPDFRFGEACYSTAHQAALELLRAGVFHIENSLNEIAEDRGAPDNYVAGIDDLHALSPDDLRDTLIAVYARPVSKWAVKEIEFAQVKEFQAWIHREWAAVSRAPANGGEPADDDDSVWVSASKLCPDKGISLKTARAFCEKNGIRNRKPSRQRLVIHAGDWANYWARKDAGEFEGLDQGNSKPSIFGNEDIVLDGAAERLRQLQAKKKAGK